MAAGLTAVVKELGVIGVLKGCPWDSSDRAALPLPPAEGSLLTVPFGPRWFAASCPRGKSSAIRDTGVGWIWRLEGPQQRDRGLSGRGAEGKDGRADGGILWLCPLP